MGRKERVMRYIDADALIADLDKGLWGKDWDKALAEAIINNAPTIDAVSVVRGEWEERTQDEMWATVDFAYCSECKQPIIHKHASPLWNYCPNCGSDMRGKDDE